MYIMLNKLWTPDEQYPEMRRGTTSVAVRSSGASIGGSTPSRPDCEMDAIIADAADQAPGLPHVEPA